MDVDDATRYCRQALINLGEPPDVDIEDLIQEYCLAKLEGNDPCDRIRHMLKAHMKESQHVEREQRMDYMPDDERDVEMTDEEHDEYLTIEREIADEHRAERIVALEDALKELEKTHPHAIPIFREILKGTSTDREIAVKIKYDYFQVRSLRRLGIRIMRDMGCPEEVILPLFGLKDQIVRKPKAYELKRSKSLGTV